MPTGWRVLTGILLAVAVTAIRYFLFIHHFRTFMFHVLLIVVLAQYGGTATAMAATLTSVIGIIFWTPYWESGPMMAKDGLAVALFALSGTFLSLFGGHHERVHREVEQALLESRAAQDALAKERKLRGLITTCGFCKRIRDGRKWTQMEQYISQRTEAQFSHGVCPDCFRTHYPGHQMMPEDDEE